MRKRKSSDSGDESKPAKCCLSNGGGPSCAPETEKDGEGAAAAASAPEERTSRETTGEKKRKARKSGKGVSSKLDESGVSAEASVSAESTQVVMAEKSEQGVGSKPEKCSVSSGEGPSSASEADVVKAEKGAEGSAAAASEERRAGDGATDDVVKKRKVRRSGKEEGEEGSAAAAHLDGLQQMAEDNPDADVMRKRKSRKSAKRVSSELEESGVLTEATEVMMAEKSEEVDMVRKTDNETSCSYNILSSLEKENGGLTSRASTKSGLEKEPISQSDNLNVCGTRRRRHKKRGSQFNANLESGTSSIVTSSMDLELLPKTPIDVSDKNLSVLSVGSRDGVLRQASDSLLLEDPSLVLPKTPDRSSPIRGVVVQHDFASADLLDRQKNQLESLIAEEASFSFQLGSGVTPVNGFTKKKLLVLDLNGILTDIVTDYRVLRNVHKAHKRIGGKAVFKRPFCDDFLKFCFERFDIGIWSSRKMYNVTDVVDYLMADTKHKLLFSWDQSRCTITGFKTMENSHKPLVLKELKRLWDKEEPDLPWEKGEYSPSNTLLVDDSPYKALCNPPYTAIFPRPFSFYDDNDNSLGPGGDLRVYLEGLAGADDVQQYVQAHPFGQKAITSTDPSWKFYRRVIQSATA